MGGVSGRVRRIVGLAISGLIVLIAVAIVIVFPRGSSSAGDRAAWFETPHADAEVVTGRIPVVAAATDPMGVAVLEFFVDGVFVEGRLYEGAPERVEAEFAWLVNTEGSFRLTVRARGTDGLWGVPETIVVAAAHHYRSEEALSPQSTTTTTEAAVPAAPDRTTSTTVAAQPTSTTAASAASCVPQPELLSPGDGATVEGRPRLGWVYREGCLVIEQTLQFTGPTHFGPEELWIQLPVDATFWRPPRLVDCAAYTWRVIAGSDDGLGESAHWSFSTDFGGEC